MTSVLIVGATSAIAHAVARHFAEDGAKLFLVGRNRERLSAVADDLKARGAAGVATYRMDVNDIAEHATMWAAATEAMGTVDVALLAHGVLPDQKACEKDVKVTLETFQTNAVSTIALLTLIANEMERHGRGTIVVISSVAGDRGRQSNYVYGASKAAVSVFAQGLRNRLARRGVHVLTVKPGLVDTPMTAHMRKNFLFASPERVARDIYQAILKGKDVIYTPWYWRFIMGVIVHIPEGVFKYMKL